MRKTVFILTLIISSLGFGQSAVLNRNSESAISFYLAMEILFFILIMV